MSDAKRKAGAAVSPGGDGRAAKRQKMPNGESTSETAESTAQMGLEFVKSLKVAKDKTGRPIATDFLTLPDPAEIPHYYEEIQLPMALDTIEDKLNNREYANISALESDIKRLIANAKSFNDKRSMIYEDAERLRKTASNWMTRHNPAYKDPSYVATPTPIPGESGGDADGAGATVPPTKEQAAPVRLSITHKAEEATTAPSPAATATITTAAISSGSKDVTEGSKDFVGKTFQQAQDQMMSEMIKYKDADSELDIFTPFINLPSRQLQDYYDLIKHPVSLKSVQKRANGIHGRAPPTGVSDFKSWDEFETEVSYIWENCRTYNEDGSEMFNLAGEFEGIFKHRLSEAKAVVEEPHQQKVKIKLGQPANPIKIKLHAKESPGPQATRATPDNSSTPGVTIDTAALERQKAHVAASVNGQRPPSSDAAAPTTTSRDSVSSSRPGSAAAAAPPTGQAPNSIRSASATSPPALTNGVKTEGQAIQATMVPPSAGRVQSGSPHPQGQPLPPPQTTAAAFAHSFYAPPQNGFERRYRKVGKTAKDSLLPNLAIQSHPQLNLPRPVRITIPASEKFTTQSVTITLTALHHHIRITPHVPIALTGKPYRLFVTVNNQRIAEAMPLLQANASEHQRDRSRPAYEGRLERGMVNRVEVEVLAAKSDDASAPTRSAAGVTPPAGEKEKEKEKEKAVELERCTVFVHLAR